MGSGVTQVFWGQEPVLSPEQPLRACPSDKGLSYSTSISLSDVLSQGSANGRGEFLSRTERGGLWEGWEGPVCPLTFLPLCRPGTMPLWRERSRSSHQPTANLTSAKAAGQTWDAHLQRNFG